METMPHGNGYSLADLDLIDQGLPLLRGVCGLLKALSLVACREALSGQEDGQALSLLAERLDTVVALFEHWQDTGPQTRCCSYIEETQHV